MTHGTITSVDQPKRFLEAINARGHNMTTLNKRAVAQILAGKPDDYVRQLLELRRTGARAAVNKFKRMLAYASPTDDRMRGTLRMYGAGPGRWSRAWSAVAKLEEKRERSAAVGGRYASAPAIAPASRNTAIRSVCSVMSVVPHSAPALVWSLSPVISARSSPSCWPSWPAKSWKLVAYKTYQHTGDKTLEPYRVIARKMLQKPADAEITDAERQLGKGGELGRGIRRIGWCLAPDRATRPAQRRRDQGHHQTVAGRPPGHV